MRFVKNHLYQSFSQHIFFRQTSFKNIQKNPLNAMIKCKKQILLVYKKYSMKTSSLIVLSFLFCLCLGLQADYSQKISWLYKRLQSRLWIEDQPFKNIMSLQHMKGLYECRFHANFIDKNNNYLTSLLRKAGLDDNNMFVTSFVLYSLIQTAQIGTIQLDDQLMIMSLKAIQTFRDKNVQRGIPQYSFWPQTFINDTWVAQPTNLINIANMLPQKLPKYLMLVLKKMGLDGILSFKEMAKHFTTPADNDDSSVNLVLLGMLKETKSKHFDFWKEINKNFQGYYQRVLKYAYRPFDNNFGPNKFANEIDPRSYYVYSDFLAKKRKQAIDKNSIPSLILPTTWLLNFQEQIDGKITLPNSNNNVDANVCANVILGISYLCLNNELEIGNLPELSQLVTDTIDLLVYVIEEKVSTRPDLALVYYPSKFDFLWFISRIINLYKRQPNIPPPFDQAFQKLSKAMKTKGTDILINSSQTGKDGETYWSQFLGNYAGKNRNQDAIFSTSLALNSLLDTWTMRKGSDIKYDSDIPDSVRAILKSGIQYLNSHLKEKMKEQNAFFSISQKSEESNLYIFPANIHVDKDNKNIDPSTKTLEDIQPGINYLMKGFVQQKQYQKMLSQTWFGKRVPTEFHGFNVSPFAYWQAEPITEVIALSVLSKYMKSEASASK